MHSIAAAPHIFWAVLFVVLPLFIVVFYAFTDESGSFSPWNIAALADYFPIFLISLELAVIATCICLLLGYPLAYAIARAKPQHQKIFIMLLMLPMWIIGIVVPVITWIACKVIAFAPIPRIQFDLWYCPYPISTWISTQGSIRGILFLIITFVIVMAIWYPFLKAYEKQCLAEEGR